MPLQGDVRPFAVTNTEVFVWFRKRKPSPAEMARELRERALTAPPAEIGIDPARALDNVWVVLMETGYPEAVASLVCFADGATSLYFSNGGGMIGAGEHDTVRKAAVRFLAMANQNAAHLTAVKDHPLPAVGFVRFYARTAEGLRSADAAQQILGAGGHPLSRLFAAGHAVITAIRETGVGQ